MSRYRRETSLLYMLGTYKLIVACILLTYPWIFFFVFFNSSCFNLLSISINWNKKNIQGHVKSIQATINVYVSKINSQYIAHYYEIVQSDTIDECKVF